MSIFLVTNRTNYFLILLYMSHMLSLSITVHILDMLIKVKSLVELRIAFVTIPRLNYTRFFWDFVVSGNILIFNLVYAGLLNLILIFI